jgi:hypothetical protein
MNREPVWHGESIGQGLHRWGSPDRGGDVEAEEVLRPGGAPTATVASSGCQRPGGEPTASGI